ncbi:MAG: PorV/PorQ family protein [Nitrospirota bacterium]
MTKIILGAIAWLVILTYQVEAGKTQALVVLKFPTSARSAGMGEVGVSCPTGIDSVFFNPAGLSLIEQREVSVFYSTLLDIDYGFVGYAQRVNGNKEARLVVVSLSMATLQVGDIEINYENGNGTSRNVAAESDYVLNLSAALKLNKRLSAGINLKKIQSELVEEVTAKAMAVDFGALLLISERLNLGAVAQNFGSDVQYREKKDPPTLHYKNWSFV